MEDIFSGSHIQARCEIHCREKVTRHMRCRPARLPGARRDCRSCLFRSRCRYMHPAASATVPPCPPRPRQEAELVRARHVPESGREPHSHCSIHILQRVGGQTGRVASSKKAQARCPGGQASKSGRRGWSRSRCRTVVLNPALSWPNAPRCEGTGRRCRSLPEV